MESKLLKTCCAWMVLCLLAAGCGCATIRRHSLSAHLSRIAFCNAEGLPTKQATALAGQLEQRRPETAWVRALPFRERASSAGWNRIALKEGSKTPYKGGLVHITHLKSDEAMEPGSEAYADLLEGLSLAEQPWKIVLMERSLLLPRTDRKRLALARLFEREGVTLVISADGRTYARSVPIGSTAAHLVRYVSMGSAGKKSAPADAASRAAAFATDAPHFALLEATEERLRWTVYDEHGKVRDILTIQADTTPVRFYSITELVAEENVSAQSAR